MQDDLYKLRSEAQQAFEEAKALEARWKILEREQRELHQVNLRTQDTTPLALM
jgi:ESCRT-I complex subunit VPS37